MKFGLDEKTVQAAEDYKLKPHESKPIRVEGQLGEDREWLVQKNLLANANNSFFAVPNVLISTANPWVPIANPTDHPRYIRKGEIIGTLSDPASFFDTPKSTEEREKFQAAALFVLSYPYKHIKRMTNQDSQRMNRKVMDRKLQRCRTQQSTRPTNSKN